MVQIVLNAKGQAPSPERVRHVASKCLGNDDDDEPIPPALIQVLTNFLTNNPGDTNFLIELPDGLSPGNGGNGYGLVTCMEDDCWCDLILLPDPERSDGGLADGIGSLNEYAMHCAAPNHAKCRDSRMDRQRIVIPKNTESEINSSSSSTTAGATPGLSSLKLESKMPDRNSFNRNASAGPSRKARLSWSDDSRSPMSSLPSTENKPPMDNKHQSAGPLTKPSPSSRPLSANLAAINISDEGESDDEILFLGSRSADHSTSTVVVVEDDDDDDDDVKPITPTQFQASVKPPYVVAWLAMPVPARKEAALMELEALRKLNPSSSELKSTIKLRKGDLKAISKSFGIKQWTPPAQAILQILPKNAIPEVLRKTFTWPDAPPPPPTVAAAPPVARPLVAAPSFAEAQQAWKQLKKAVRQEASRSEYEYLAHQQTNGTSMPILNIPAIKGIIVNRVLEAARRFTNPDIAPWTPPSPVLLQFCPGLRAIIPLAMHRFLPLAVGDAGPVAQPGGVPSAPVGWVGPIGASGIGLGGMPGAYPNPEDSDYGLELDRPQNQQGFADFFQESLEGFKEDATIEDGLRTLELASIEDKLPGANFTLLPHQVLGVAFMVKREERDSGALGGLLCDAMGLGKTVQTIGIMLARQKRPADYKRAPQLIVAPVALLTQWKTEIETKTSNDWSVHIHHGAGRLKSAAKLKQYDIILTSYGTLRSEAFPNGRTKKRKSRSATTNGDSSDDGSDDDAPNRMSPLLSIKWFRVILDEAHNIRNKGTSTCKAVMGLDVLHPWFLTGTPVVNTLTDLAPALRFIGAMDYEDFRSRVGKIEKRKPKLAAKRTQAILRPLIMRRNKESEINGQRILTLPPKTTNLTPLNFELDERAIYASLEARARLQVNKFIKEGTLMKHYSVVLVLLTRLRQCVNHPWLLRRKPGDEGHPNDMVVGEELFGGNLDKCCTNDADEYGRAVGLLGGAEVESLKRKLEDRHKRMTSDDSNEVEDEDVECSICYEPFDGTELITACQHIYCKPCLSNLFTQPIRDATALTDEEAQRGCRMCPLCRGVIERGRIFRIGAIYQPPAEPEVNQVDEDDEVDVKPDPLDRKGKKRAVPTGFFDKKPKRSKSESDEEVEEQDEMGAEIPPSTKMKKLLELVQGYLAEDKTVKILVFSQFVAFLDLLSDFLNIHGIRNIGYRGSMNQGERSEAIRRFSMPAAIADSISVMLISTKAGGVGLNLTMASKVICCDLAWNPATEHQAVDRAHRIGQTQPVTVERLVISETVEDRLLEIQEQKGLLADGALGEGSVAKLGRLTLENIRRLFAITNDDDE